MGLSSTKPVVLWIAYYIFNAACIVLYIISQLVLVIRTLDDRWPIGAILFGVGFFAAGQVLVYGFSVQICNAIKHYLDGLFFGSLCTLLAVMMVYKYYDMITKEDLEFSVGSKQAVWEVKEPLLGNGAPSAFAGFDDVNSTYSHPSAAGQPGAYHHAPPMPSYYSNHSGYSNSNSVGGQMYPPSKY
ncbi:Chitin synthase, class 7 [Cystobasidiomycetes sp. EMM_F5]